MFSRLLALLCVLVAASTSFAATPLSEAPWLKKPVPPPPQDDEEEEDKPQPRELPPSDPTAPAPTPEQQRLISGAPLSNPNVAVHIIEQKTFVDAHRLELVLYPIATQINGQFTQHAGSQLGLVYHLQENFALQLTGGYNWFNVETAFNGELVDKFGIEAQSASSLLWTWGVTGGVEVTPIYGKFALFDATLVHFSVVVTGGLGVGGTRHLLTPEAITSSGALTEATYGDTGVRAMGSVGAGFRVQLGQHFALRLELRDVVYAARMTQVNGCSADDLRAMNDLVTMAKDPTTAKVTSSCNTSTFSGTFPNSTIKRSTDVPRALNLVKAPNSDVLNNLGLYLGVSVVF